MNRLTNRGGVRLRAAVAGLMMLAPLAAVAADAGYTDRIIVKYRAAGAAAAAGAARTDGAELSAQRFGLRMNRVRTTALGSQVLKVDRRLTLDEARRHRRTADAPPIYVETCPHYLFLNDESPAGTYAKVNPPVRGQSDVDAMWEGVLDGSITTIGTDHVPRKRATKDTDIWAASNGFPGTGLMLPILLHEGYHRRGVPLEILMKVAAENSARIYRMPGKGSIEIGKDADLVLVDPDLERTVDPATLESNSDYSPYEGMTLKGWPVRTLVRGRTVALDGRITDAARSNHGGRYLKRL